METLSNTVVSCYRAMTIKTKKDAERFLKSFQGRMFICDVGDAYDVEVIKDDGDVKVLYRSIHHRGNIYLPYIQADDPICFVWKYRKAFNKRINGLG